MPQVNTRVPDWAHAKLTEQATAQQMSMYDYVQQILQAAARGHVRVVLEVEKGKTIFDKPVKEQL